MAVDSVKNAGHNAGHDTPRSPRADYGLSDDFDPAKYDFYNLVAYSVQGTRSGHLGEKHSQGSLDHDEVESNHDEGSLSPIEELDDDAHSVQAVQQNARSGSPPTLQDESLRNGSSRTNDSGQIDLNGNAREPSMLELHSNLLFSRQHLETILGDRTLALNFITFLHTHLSESVPILRYYFGAVNVLKALRYARSVTDGLEAVDGHAFTSEIDSATMAWVIEDKIARALDVLVHDDLPAFIAYTYAERIDHVLRERMVGKQERASHATPDGLAEAFVLSDPASPDNPIVFTSEGFHALTGYSRTDVVGRNCRFLSGEKTNQFAQQRLRNSLNAEREHCEILLNYRKDGSPFMNMIMCVPLRDRSNKVRYYLGAQLDVTTFVDDFTGFKSLLEVPQLGEKSISNKAISGIENNDGSMVEEFTRLTQVFSSQELEKLSEQERNEENGSKLPKPDRQLLLKAPLSDSPGSKGQGSIIPAPGFYQNYLLVRPHPSLRVLFASSGLQSSGIVQKSILDCIGGSSRIRQELLHALEMGRKVTAKVRLTLPTSKSINCWLHCTPLLGATESIGVWMIILVDMHSDGTLSQDPTRARYPGEQTSHGDQQPAAADPTPWDKLAGTNGFFEEESQYPMPMKSQINPATRNVAKAPRRSVDDKKRVVVKDETLIDDRIVQNGTSVKQTLKHNEKSDNSSARPLTTGSTGSSGHKHSHSALEAAKRSSEDQKTGKSSPVKVPGESASAKEDGTGAIRTVRKKTYKSLSPYGIIFDD